MDTTDTTEVGKSLYEQLGGSTAIAGAVEILYRRMEADERVAPFFDGVDMQRQAAKLSALLALVTGGPNAYTGQDLRTGHKHLVARGLGDEHVDIVIEHLGAALAELGAGAEQIQAVAAIAESVREDVLDR